MMAVDTYLHHQCHTHVCVLAQLQLIVVVLPHMRWVLKASPDDMNGHHFWSLLPLPLTCLLLRSDKAVCRFSNYLVDSQLPTLGFVLESMHMESKHK